jgi:hypothetical protein
MPVDIVEGIFLRASCFDGGIRNVKAGCDRLPSKSVNFNAYNACVGFDFMEMDGRW